MQASAPHQLQPRTILNGKYLIGRVLGQGGFGITYIGWDLNLEMKVAVKEYYPTGFVTREVTGIGSATVQPFTGSQGEYFLKGREKFINEGRLLAKFFSLPGIVTIKDYFQENGTAYISMEYIDGQTLKDYLSAMGGKLPAAQLFDMMKPVMTSLAEVHKTGLIHRDISPDNIMINKEGQMKLLDFGAAREFTDSGIKSISIMLKPGYAPEEQYRSKGLQGPWTDVYALSATIYKCLTGVTPEESVERVHSDEVKSPSALGISISWNQEAAVMTGMAVMQVNRHQSVSELYSALYGTAAPEQMNATRPVQSPVTMPVTVPAPYPSASSDVNTPQGQVYAHTPVDTPVNTLSPESVKQKKLIKILLTVAAICAIAIGVLFLTRNMWEDNYVDPNPPGLIHTSNGDQPQSGGTATPAPTPSLTVGSDSYIRTFTLGAFQIEAGKPDSQQGWFTDGADDERSPYTVNDFTSSKYLVLEFDKKPNIELEFAWIGDANNWDWANTYFTPHDSTVVIDLTRIKDYSLYTQNTQMKIFICLSYNTFDDITLIDAFFADKT